MKKKFSLWINLAVICLCVCSIAIGVYAATSATLTVSGQVGFEAHGVDMTINGTLSGYVLQSEQDTAQGTRTRTLSAVTLGGEQKITQGTMSFADATGTESGTDVYFTDLVLDENGEVPSIVLSLSLTNTSLFKVDATIDVSVLSTAEITATADQTSLTFDAKDGENATQTLTITFTLVDSENSIATAIDLSDVTTPIITFNKYVFSVRKLLKNDSSKGYYLQMGDYQGTALRWFPFAYSTTGAEGTFSAISDPTEELASGTYYFISEYAGVGLNEVKNDILFDALTLHKTPEYKFWRYQQDYGNDPEPYEDVIAERYDYLWELKSSEVEKYFPSPESRITSIIKNTSTPIDWKLYDIGVAFTWGFTPYMTVTSEGILQDDTANSWAGTDACPYRYAFEIEII